MENRIRTQEFLLPAHGLIKARLAGMRSRGDRGQRDVFAPIENDHPDQRDNENDKPGKQRQHHSARSGDSFAALEAEPKRVVVAKDTGNCRHYTGDC
jgi:hypothetical protein